ncbi:MAG TPA: hypothetical protein VG889_02725 [Rhizomicrobium sp.]|nr:hypothetical protein [Rhizomicrobium sp.]
MRYRKRENLFTNGESEYRIDDDALVRRAPDGSEQRIAWRDVKALRVRFFPTMAKPWLHEFRVEAAGATMTIDNGHFAGVADFEDRSASYTPFVRAALARVQAQAPKAQVRIGSRPLAFWATMSFVALAFAMLAAVVIVLPLPAPFPLAAIAKLAVIAYGLYLLPRWVRRNWPRGASFDSAAAELPPA